MLEDEESGYLSVSGFYPTCGCRCEGTVKVVESKSTPVRIIKQSNNCNWEYSLSSNANIEQLISTDVLMQSFFCDDFKVQTTYAQFYPEAELSPVAPEITVALLSIPFGLQVESNQLIAFSYNEEQQFDYGLKLSALQSMVSQFTQEETLNYLLSKQFDLIAEEENDVIDIYSGDSETNFKSKEEISDVLNELKTTYDLAEQMVNDKVVLRWDKKQNRFTVKETRPKTLTISFSEF